MIIKLLGVYLRSQIFDVGNGNEDKEKLVDPASYGLENTANFYFPSMDTSVESERVGAWLIRLVMAGYYCLFSNFKCSPLCVKS